MEQDPKASWNSIDLEGKALELQLSFSFLNYVKIKGEWDQRKIIFPIAYLVGGITF